MKRKNTVTVPYKKLDDVPYELTEPVLIRMQKLERGLKFVLDNLDSEELTQENAAAASGFAPRYFLKLFREHFGMPFERYVTKLKLRQAARDIRDDHYPKGVGARYGFSTLPSFTRAFRREFGISPREFYYGDYNIPDMRFPEEVEGLAVRLEYRQMNAIYVEGLALPVPQGNDTYIMDALAYPFTGQGRDALTGAAAVGILAVPEPSRSDEAVRDSFDKKQNRGGRREVGIWWYDPDEQLRYLYGVVQERFDTVMLPEERVKDIETVGPYEDIKSAGGKSRVRHVSQVIQGGNYAVFSYERPEDDGDIPLKSRILSRFIFKEWVPVNRKLTNMLGFTYEVFDENRVYIYLPMQPGMDVGSEIGSSETIISKWAKYIDDHIDDDLTTESLAYIAGYSRDNYRDIFQLYYGLTPSDYVKRRRAFLAGEDSMPEETFDLKEYYEENEHELDIEIKYVEPKVAVLSEIIQKSDRSEETSILGLVGYWFRHDFDWLERGSAYLREGEGYVKIYIWGSDPEYVNGKAVYKYYVGALTSPEGHIVGALTEENMPGGKYGVFSRKTESDEADIEDALVFLHRLAFGTWIQKNRARVDLTRKTFVLWHSHKLWFYVPVL